MTVTTHPFESRTAEQRAEALLLANRVRAERASLKAAVRRGDVHPVDVILNPPGYARTMHVAVLLGAVPKIGPVKVRRILRALHVSESRTLAGLSDRQRRELAVVLGGDVYRPSGGDGV